MLPATHQRMPSMVSTEVETADCAGAGCIPFTSTGVKPECEIAASIEASVASPTTVTARCGKSIVTDSTPGTASSAATTLDPQFRMLMGVDTHTVSNGNAHQAGQWCTHQLMPSTVMTVLRCAGASSAVNPAFVTASTRSATAREPGELGVTTARLRGKSRSAVPTPATPASAAWTLEPQFFML